MSSLSNMSAQEIRELLDDYGIKHGPVVDSTRRLYEKKLREAMAKGERARPTPDKTFYREEEEEVTYVYRTPIKIDNSGDRGSYMRSRPELAEREFEHQSSFSSYSRSKPEYQGRDFVDEHHMYDKPSSQKPSYLNSTPKGSGQGDQSAKESSRLFPPWVQIVFFLVIAVFLYLVFSSMEMNESFKGIE